MSILTALGYSVQWCALSLLLLYCAFEIHYLSWDIVLVRYLLLFLHFRYVNYHLYSACALASMFRYRIPPKSVRRLSDQRGDIRSALPYLISSLAFSFHILSPDSIPGQMDWSLGTCYLFGPCVTIGVERLALVTYVAGELRLNIFVSILFLLFKGNCLIAVC